jgi:hypothetical protein
MIGYITQEYKIIEKAQIYAHASSRIQTQDPNVRMAKICGA